MRSHPRAVGGYRSAVEDIRVSREGTIESITATGEIDVSNVATLDDALRSSFSGDTTSCVLDLSEIGFMDSSVIHLLVRWSKETQVSAREALAIIVGGQDTEAARVLSMVGLMTHLPVFASHAAAIQALELGRKPRTERPLRWLSDLELAAEREQAQASSDAAARRLDEATSERERAQADSDAATRRLDDAIVEQDTRRRGPDR